MMKLLLLNFTLSDYWFLPEDLRMSEEVIFQISPKLLDVINYFILFNYRILNCRKFFVDRD